MSTQIDSRTDYLHFHIAESFDNRVEAEKFHRAVSRVVRELEAEYGDRFYDRYHPALAPMNEFTGGTRYHVLARFSVKIKERGGQR